MVRLEIVEIPGTPGVGLVAVDVKGGWILSWVVDRWDHLSSTDDLLEDEDE